MAQPVKEPINGAAGHVAQQTYQESSVGFCGALPTHADTSIDIEVLMG
jgi:hypothetical protein